jgi:segregation and condensation protein B
MMNLEKAMEAILFYKNEPLSIKKLAELLDKSEEEIKEVIPVLSANLGGRGITLMQKEDELALSTAPEFSSLIEKITKDELSKDLGKAALDTLTIILYYGPATKAQIDNIRGVNSGFILRNLLIRGLISRVTNEADQRSFLYKTTFELMSYLGITNINELPEYDEIRKLLNSGLKEIEKSEADNRETQE